jgi:hypothetical protein
MKARTFGLPMKCPSCPPRRYYGILKGEQVPTHLVKFGKADVCTNCKKPLVPTIERA